MVVGLVSLFSFAATSLLGGVLMTGTLYILFWQGIEETPKEPLSIVCMQDAPIRYDWNNNLIVEGMEE